MARVKPLMEVLRGVTRFGRLIVINEAPRIISPSGFAALAANVRCDCGVETVVRAGGLNAGHTRSCGCLQRELTAKKIANRSRTHGQAGKRTRTPEYYVWSTMKARCFNPNDQNYSRYGGRDITVCDHWRGSFEAFFADMGPRPSSRHSIERDDNDGNYEPGNCRWATQIEQASNRRSSVNLAIDGRIQTVIQWSRETGMDDMTIYARLRKGWDAKRAVYAPKRKMAPRKSA